MELIKDQEQFDNFVAILPELQGDEVYFISLSARKKYLTPEEREYFLLQRTEMYARQVARSKEQLYYVMRKLSAIFSSRLTENGRPMPVKANVVYININPSSMVKAYQEFSKGMNHEIYQILSTIQKGDKQPNYDAFRYADRQLMNCIQKAKADRYYLDVDMDTDDFLMVQELQTELGNHEIEHHVIKTRGGWHVLIIREDLNSKKNNFRLYDLVRELNSRAGDGEVIFNKNQMVPVPGTLQAGELVKLIY